MEIKIYIDDNCYLMSSPIYGIAKDGGISYVSLYPAEYKVLDYLLSHHDQSVSREELARCLWGIHAEEKEPRGIDTHISAIRKKMEKLSEGLSKCLETQHGFGAYILRITEKAAALNAGQPMRTEDISTATEIEKMYMRMKQLEDMMHRMDVRIKKISAYIENELSEKNEKEREYMLRILNELYLMRQDFDKKYTGVKSFDDMYGPQMGSSETTVHVGLRPGIVDNSLEELDAWIGKSYSRYLELCEMADAEAGYSL